MNITSTILDSTTKKPLENVNIYVNTKAVTKTDANGKFTLNNIKDNDFINTSYVGYSEAFAEAKFFLKTVYLDSSGYNLNEVVVRNVFKKTNWLLWLGIGIVVTATYAYNEHQNSKKIVKAKI